MSGRFEGKVALVTGGGTGIGAAAVRRLSAEGARVVVTGRRAELIEQVAAGAGGIAVAGSAADDHHVAMAVKAAVEQFGGLDILVANAGVPSLGPVEATDLDGFRAIQAVNVEGVLLALRHSIPEMRKRGGGAVVMIASTAAIMGYPALAAYMTSKAALLGLNRSVAVDYGPENIRSNVVCPALVKSEMMNESLEAAAGNLEIGVADLVRKLSGPVPLRRLGAPEEVAAAIAFLASDDASFITGAELVADGGCSIVDAATLAFGNA